MTKMKTRTRVALVLALAAPSSLALTTAANASPLPLPRGVNDRTTIPAEHANTTWSISLLQNDYPGLRNVRKSQLSSFGPYGITSLVISRQPRHGSATVGSVEDMCSYLDEVCKDEPNYFGGGSVYGDPYGDAFYTPDRGYAGVDSFAYTASDTAGHTWSATAVVNVGRAHTVADKVALEFPNPVDVVVGDTPAPSVNFDPSNNDVGIFDSEPKVVTQPKYGKVEQNCWGGFVYTSNQSLLGRPRADRFTYSVYDEHLQRNIIGTITVNPVVLPAVPVITETVPNAEF